LFCADPLGRWGLKFFIRQKSSRKVTLGRRFEIRASKETENLRTNLDRSPEDFGIWKNQMHVDQVRFIDNILGSEAKYISCLSNDKTKGNF
jgi:hypothetical protein